jgi:hypothetical protein
VTGSVTRQPLSFAGDMSSKNSRITPNTYLHLLRILQQLIAITYNLASAEKQKR